MAAEALALGAAFAPEVEEGELDLAQPGAASRHEATRTTVGKRKAA